MLATPVARAGFRERFSPSVGRLAVARSQPRTLAGEAVFGQVVSVLSAKVGLFPSCATANRRK